MHTVLARSDAASVIDFFLPILYNWDKIYGMTRKGGDGTEHEKYTVCGVCPHACRLKEGDTGFCRARVCRDGRIVPENYGRITSLALDPIEKKPLAGFYPGSLILSAGSYGCNFRCPFCQNHSISDIGGEQA